MLVVYIPSTITKNHLQYEKKNRTPEFALLGPPIGCLTEISVGHLLLQLQSVFEVSLLKNHWNIAHKEKSLRVTSLKRVECFSLKII